MRKGKKGEVCPCLSFGLYANALMLHVRSFIRIEDFHKTYGYVSMLICLMDQIQAWSKQHFGANCVRENCTVLGIAIKSPGEECEWKGDRCLYSSGAANPTRYGFQDRLPVKGPVLLLKQHL